MLNVVWFKRRVVVQPAIQPVRIVGGNCQDEQRAAARAEAEAKKQERENISAEIAASREERQDDNEQRMKDRDKKRMAKERK